MNQREQNLLIEQVTSAWRSRGVDGDVRAHPAWHDLDVRGREDAFAATVLQRALEAAADPRGLSTTAHAVLGRIRREA